MKRDDHILWKIVRAYDMARNLKLSQLHGEIPLTEYSTKMQPVCFEVINTLLILVEEDKFIDKNRELAKFFSEKDWEEPDRHNKYDKAYNDRQRELFDADWVTREYDKFVVKYKEAVFEPELEKRASKLVLAMDSFVNWMHGCFFISYQIMRKSPITGDCAKDYDIALHTMYLLYHKGSCPAAFEYLNTVFSDEETHDEHHGPQL